MNRGKREYHIPKQHKQCHLYWWVEIYAENQNNHPDIPSGVRPRAVFKFVNIPRRLFYKLRTRGPDSLNKAELRVVA
jgi:hypothetical protein